ncbi:Erp family outer-surface lipoprotein [Borreliella burgdorferi]|uniref:Erp family outer-surface lipoprotein n=2 Tax=Borreliella burgdorferi TaxID=139 RepID=UPI001E4EBF1B|nr:Erp family outer-surface lipoprotein [Borreliella burgdorferi]MCD2374552.1 Erp family outer-surface lipoprotein [Borreliella burgdorferi]MCD2375761.1 Erp family outer-surface lipoprotein [Borreliella burgdorferi]MCD2410206.1 Erp family outer-surface lipoprotein [Borreliella burgdorferi]MCD2416078.1 Erp family outer-surface lipoprotein [Borreliella burgdorferi]
MNGKMRMLIICAVFAMISSCGNFTSSLSEQGSSNTIKFSEFTVKIKNKNSSNWENLGDLVVRKEEDGIATGLNAGGHSATFFCVEESEVNNFVKAMTEGGSFKASLYYGYKEEQSVANGIQNKEIITKIENINGVEHVAFLGDKINNSAGGDKIAEYAISLEELKKNLK